MKYLYYSVLVLALLTGGRIAFSAGSEEQQPEQGKQELTARYLSQLNHAKMEKLMQRLGKKAPDSFYNCLCRADGGGAAAGVGVSYHPQPVKPYNKRYSCNREGPPCMASGMGCWRFPLPNDEKIWAACMKANPLENAAPIDAAVIHAADLIPSAAPADDTLQVPRLTSEEEQLLERLSAYRELCLPNVSRTIEDIVLWSGKGGAIVKEALEKAAGSANVCEEAITVSLFLQGQDGLYPSEVMAATVWPFVPYSSTISAFLPLVKGDALTPEDIDPASIMDDAIGDNNPLQGYAVKGIQLPSLKDPIQIKNIMSAIDALDSAYSTYQTNTSFRKASDLFVESKGWQQEKRDTYLLKTSEEIRSNKRKIAQSNKKLKAALRGIRPSEREQQVIGGMYDPPGSKVPNDAPLWQEYFRKQEQLRHQAAVEQGPWLSKIIDLNIHRQALEYREALRSRGCDRFLEESRRSCHK